jgi:hypothetical protein
LLDGENLESGEPRMNVTDAQDRLIPYGMAWKGSSPERPRIVALAATACFGKRVNQVQLVGRLAFLAVDERIELLDLRSFQYSPVIVQCHEDGHRDDDPVSEMRVSVSGVSVASRRYNSPVWKIDFFK